MAELFAHAIYVAGPFMLAAAIAWKFGARCIRGREGVGGASWAAFGLGLPAFLAAWICSTIAMVGAGVAGVGEGTVLNAFIISTAAGVFEESARWLAFRFLPPLRTRRDGPNMLMYAAGHSGMESIIVAGTLALTIFVVTNYPEILSDQIREQGQAVVDRAPALKCYDALERVTVGFIIHTAFTGVVLLGFRRRSGRFLLCAMAWHFGHDMVALNLHRLSTHWTVHAAWIAFIVVVYGWAIVVLYRRLAGVAPAEPPAEPAAIP